MSYKPFVKTDEELIVKKPYQFFLVRPTGIHPAFGEKFTPSVVQLIEGKLFSSDNELDPLVYSHKDDFMTPCDDPFQCNLEWQELSQ